jgi:N-acetylglucosaminyl-diphospho-decaprenol L-rhamnosyltransferase
MAEAPVRVSAPPPTLSIVVPTRDTRELTLACLAAVRRAAGAAGAGESGGGGWAVGPPPQVILVDDASGDGTAEAARLRHPDLVVLQTPAPVGFTRAANLGLAAAAGDVVLLLNSDTEIAPGALAALAAAFAAEPRLGAAGAALAYPDGSPQWSGGAAPTLPWLFGLASGLPALLGRLPSYRRLRPPGAAPAKVEWVTGAALALRRAALAEVGPLDERFRFYAQDLDLCLRLTAAGWRVALLPGVRVMHHHGATIGRAGAASGAAAGAQHPELLWTDLLRWADKHRGPAWAARARRALAAGASLRLAGRRLATPFVPTSRREPFRRTTSAYARARRALLSP